MMPIYLIRHGKTQANLLHLYCGSTDLPLCPQGVEELKHLRYSLPPARFLTSGMRRTEETLEALFGSVPHERRLEFREVNFGRFEMHSYEELKDDADYQAWLTGDNLRNVPPGGESGEAMKCRVLSAYQKLQAENLPTVLITHGGVIAAILEAQFPKEKKSRYQLQPEPGYGVVISEEGYAAIPVETI